jgi:hypothetical protein
MKTALQELINQIDERIEKSKQFMETQDEVGVLMTTMLIAGFMESKLFAQNLLEIEKEQHEKTYFKGWDSIGNRDEDFEQYYNETFIKSNYPEFRESSKQKIKMQTIYFQPPGINPEYCERGMFMPNDLDYIYYLDEPCKILISDVKIIDKENVIIGKDGLLKIKQQEQ